MNEYIGHVYIQGIYKHIYYCLNKSRGSVQVH